MTRTREVTENWGKKRQETYLEGVARIDLEVVSILDPPLIEENASLVRPFRHVSEKLLQEILDPHVLDGYAVQGRLCLGYMREVRQVDGDLDVVVHLFAVKVTWQLQAIQVHVFSPLHERRVMLCHLRRV